MDWVVSEPASQSFKFWFLSKKRTKQKKKKNKLLDPDISWAPLPMLTDVQLVHDMIVQSCTTYTWPQLFKAGLR